MGKKEKVPKEVKKPAEPEEVSIRAYARMKGVTEGAVRKALDPANPKIIKGVKGKGRETRIIVAVADKEWAENINPSYDRAPQLLKNLPMPETTVDTTAELSELNIAEVRKRQEIVELQLLQHKLGVEQGKYVQKLEIEKHLFALGAEFRGKFQNIGKMVIDDVIAASNNRAEALRILDEYVIGLLDDITKLPERAVPQTVKDTE